MADKPFWEAAFSNLDAVDTFGAPASELADVVRLLPRGAKALDLGCGEGRNALYLAAQGLDVTAIDISVAGIAKLKHFAAQRGVSIKAEVRDMNDYVFDETYDLIVAHGCLHLVQRIVWKRLIEELKAHTNPAGYNVVVVFTDVIPAPDDLKEFHVGLFREGELFEHYGDWKALLRQSYILEDEHPGNIKHRHPINKLVAQNNLT